jgi:hypothetical protein
MRGISAALVISSVLVSNAFAASVAPLPNGKPAGFSKAAALGPNFGVILMGMGVVIGGVALAASNGSNGVTGPVTTNTTRSGLP